MLPSVSSREILRLVESFGLSGSWGWTFDTNDHVWSPGLYGILGLPTGSRADLALLQSLVHPDDRAALPNPAEIMQSGMPHEQTFRIIRPDTAIRTVISRSETYFSPSGRPFRAMGTLVDVSDREVIARAQAERRTRNRAIFDAVKAFTSTTAVYPFQDVSPEYVELVGLPKADLIRDPALPIVEHERAYWRDYAHERYIGGSVVHIMPNITLADGSIVKYRMIMVPMLDAAGRVGSWSNYVAPLHVQASVPPDLSEALDDRIEGHHVRAARALLDWAMSDLASASGLSMSTIRRLEESADPRGGRSRQVAVASLRRYGIVFSLLDDATIAIGLRGRGRMPAPPAQDRRSNRG